jgi:hypothetical protein
MRYILWELGNLKDYVEIESGISFCFNRALVNHIKRAECKIQWALDYYDLGCITKSVLLDMLAKSSLEFYDLFMYILLKHSKISQQIGEYIASKVHRIRDHISITMGALVGTVIAMEIANTVVEISQFADDISSDYNLFVFLSLNQHLLRAIDDLDIVLVLMSKDCIKQSLILNLIYHSICKLNLVKMKIDCFLKHNLINEANAAYLHAEIDDFIIRLNNFEINTN